MNALTQAETEAKSEDPKPEQYALEIQAVRRAGDRMVITRSGSTFLGLRGLDAVRWLLTLEAAQTQGPRDEWRISQELAAQLITVPSGGLTYYQDEFGDVVSEPPVWNFSTSAFERLDLMGILTYTPRPPEWGGGFSYEVFKSSRPLLEEIANGHPTPFAVLAAALLRDENAQILDALRLNVNQTLPDGAAEATALQARMVAHEIRNALIPSQLALSRLASDLGDSASSEPFQRSRARVEAGLLRALQFADEMLRVANLGVEPSTSFDVMAAVRDAVAGVSSELNGSLQLTVPQEPALVSGPRARFVLAVTNLLRNAAQAVHAAPPSSGKAGTVALAIEVREQEVAIHVDDDGPGVPPEQRRAIFEQGIALRPGGSGQGLSMVRQVVEGEMQGAVSCGGSPLGGARFEIVVPTKKAQSR
ncbi:Sensory box histidine kinase [Chondromyces apiculatus DSM 436]|uniref:histidine kinase n=2 Tax=Chondromyces apiculatus TaxID=51 RepID=A0A017THS0_9BACT|nr:Sensory box histidine kinase [Chondromyces apiculatus DSM 436]